MQRNLKITIITVAYNSELYIENTIKSVIAQTYKNIEYIIIDGHSTDSTASLITKYQKNLAFWISEKDESMYDAINKGIRFSTGDYILVLNSDDFLYHKDCIAKIVNFINNNPDYEGYYGNLVRFYQDKGNYRKVKLRDVTYKRLLLSEHCTFVPHPTLFVSKSVIQKIGLYNLNYKYASDFDFILRILRSGLKLKHVPLFVTVFREHESSITSSGKISAERTDILVKNDIAQYNALYRYFNYYKGWIVYKLHNVI